LIAATELEGYFREAESWDADRAAHFRRSARTAWWVAGAGWLCAVACAGARLLMPLKSVDPFVVRVDNSTGIVDVVPVYAGSATPEEAVTRYFLTHYLTVCERFNFATAESDYEECGAFHSRATQSGVVRLVDRNQSCLAAERAQGWQHGASAGQFGELLHARQRAVGPRPSALSESGARVRVPRNLSATGSRPFSTPTRIPPRTRRHAAGIPWASRSSISNRNPKSGRPAGCEKEHRHDS
jgi:hypothetical protein